MGIKSLEERYDCYISSVGRCLFKRFKKAANMEVPIYQHKEARTQLYDRLAYV